MLTSLKSPLRIALFASAIGLAFSAATPVYAQDDESITVNAPRFHNSEGTRLNGPLERVSLSSSVRYGDLNLRTRSGARELKLRVRDEAQNVCTRIAEAYPVREATGSSCYKAVLNDGLIHADAAILDARDTRYSD